MNKLRLLRGFTAFPDIAWIYVFCVFRRNLKVFAKTWKANLMFNFIEPLLYLWAMGLGLGTYVTNINGLSYLTFLAPGLIASSAMFATTYEMTYDSFTRMNHEKIFHGMVVTPISMDDVVMGEILFGTFKGTLYGLVFALVVGFFGVVKSWWILFIPIPLILMSFIFSILSLVWTSLAPNYDSFGYFFTLFISPMFLFAGIFFPTDALPAVVRLLPWFTPLFHTVEIIRPLVLGQTISQIYIHLLWLTGFILLMIKFPLVMVKNKLIR